MSQVLRLSGGMLIATLGALTIARAGGAFVQSVSLFATEFGYWLTLIAGLMILLPGWHRSLMWRTGMLLGSTGATFLWMPVLKAVQAAGDLQALLDARFGTEQRQHGEFSEKPRLEPFSMTELVIPTDSKPVRYERQTLKKVAGQE